MPAPGDLLHLDIKKLVRIQRHRIASPATAATPSGASAGSTSTSPSTTTRASPTPPSIPDEKRGSAIAASALQPWTGTPGSASASRPCSPTTGPPIAPSASPRPVTTRPPPPPHQTLHAPHQRQGRTLHPDRPPEWAYARSYKTPTSAPSSCQRGLHHYNWHRPHASLDHQPPISRSGFDQNNLLSLHI